MPKHIKTALSGLKVLLVDDEDLLAWSIETELHNLKMQVARAASISEALAKFPKFQADIAICDLRLPDGNGLDLLKKWHHDHPQMPVILITAHGAIDSAITAIRLGAFDYLQKPFDMKDLIAALQRAGEVSYLRQKVRKMAGKELDTSSVEIIGHAIETQKLKKRLELIAQSKADTAMICGESGVGKELAAQAIHQWSSRFDQPFVEINCASIPESLLESELFGHEKGAFTDARERKLGLFEIGQNGTIFLDEIGEMPPKLQAKLLRVLEVKRFRRLGGVKEIAVHARIVVATNRDLKRMIQTDDFRTDLYFRLNVLPVYIPPLRERREDVKILSKHFLEKLSRDLEIEKPQLPAATISHLCKYSWPGNIRELRNCLQRALILHEPEVLEPEHLEFDFQWTELSPPQPDHLASIKFPGSNNDTIKRMSTFDTVSAKQNNSFPLPNQGLCLDKVEKNFISQALEKAKFNQTKAAQLLGISRHTLRYRLEKHAMQHLLKN
ncbi:MAG: sigma-54-dependent transcriptional regulator [Oligoflexales bacterium]